MDTTKAHDQLKAKISAGIPGYAHSKVWKTLDDTVADLKQERIDLAILGIPPHFRGSILPDADLDLRLIGTPLSTSQETTYSNAICYFAESLPQVSHWLVEKPVSAKQPTEQAGQAKVAKAWARSNAIVGVGYHLASLKVVQAALQFIKERNLKIMSTQARYNMAYEFAVSNLNCDDYLFSVVLKCLFCTAQALMVE